MEQGRSSTGKEQQNENEKQERIREEGANRERKQPGKEQQTKNKEQENDEEKEKGRNKRKSCTWTTLKRITTTVVLTREDICIYVGPTYTYRQNYTL